MYLVHFLIFNIRKLVDIHKYLLQTRSLEFKNIFNWLISIFNIYQHLSIFVNIFNICYYQYFQQ